MLPQKCYLANHNQEIVRLVFRKCWRLQVIDVIKGARGPDFGHARWVFLCVVFRDINNPIQTIHNSSDSDSQKQANILSRIYTKTTKIWKMIAVVLAFLIILHKQSHLKWCIVFIFIFFFNKWSNSVVQTRPKHCKHASSLVKKTSSKKIQLASLKVSECLSLT